jgi:hypothetical protein
MAVTQQPFGHQARHTALAEVSHSDDLLLHHQQSHALYAAECGTSKLSVVEGCARVALPCHVALSKRLALHVNLYVHCMGTCMCCHAWDHTSGMPRQSTFLTCNIPMPLSCSVMQGRHIYQDWGWRSPTGAQPSCDDEPNHSSCSQATGVWTQAVVMMEQMHRLAG